MGRVSSTGQWLLIAVGVLPSPVFVLLAACIIGWSLLRKLWRRPETAPQRRNALVSQLRHGDAASGQLADARPLGYGAAPVAQPGPVAPSLSPLLVRAGRLELPRPLGQQILSLPRLPFRHARRARGRRPASNGTA